MTLAMNAVGDPARPPVPGGLRVSPRFPGSARAHPPRQRRRPGDDVKASLRAQPRGDVIGQHCSSPVLLLAVGDRPRSASPRVILQSAIKGAPSFGIDLITNGPSTIFPEKAGFRPAIIGTPLPDRRRDPPGRAARRRRGRLPGGVRRQDALVEPADRAQHPEPGGGALDHLRDPRARLHRPRAARPRLRHRGRLAHPGAAGAADGDHRRAARRSGRYRPRSARGRWRSARPSGRRSAARSCPPRFPGSPQA